MRESFMEEIDGGNFLDIVDDFLDFPPEETSDASESADFPATLPCSAVAVQGCDSVSVFSGTSDSDFSADLSVPYEEIVQLEWLSNFVEDSFSCEGMMVVESKGLPGRSKPGRARSKRSRPAAFYPRPPVQLFCPVIKRKKMMVVSPEVRKCSHCEITKTPQWRAGPLGPKTLCNACGVRFKSGRLFPEYRPAASPSFVPALHSNSHRKVIEMRNRADPKPLAAGDAPAEVWWRDDSLSC